MDIKKDQKILETKELFSKSILWELQKEAYDHFGMQAWTSKGVPFYLTSNPHTAGEYVNMTISYLQDCMKEGARTRIDVSSPIYIFDLGAGSGRFAFLFLKQLVEALDQLALHTLKICYVITDFVQSNLDFCTAHPQMHPFIQKGILDFALYDHSQTEKGIELQLHKVKLNAPLKNPAILIANYFFDTIPQDLFKVVDGKLQSGNITLSIPTELAVESKSDIDPAWINHLTASYDYSSYNPNDFYRNNVIDLVLNEYCQKFEGMPFLFPTGACQTIEYFRKLTDNRFLLLAGDQGVCTEQQIREWGEPHIARHGSFSIAVSYHALKSYFAHAGGMALLTTQPDPLFVVMAAVAGGKSEDHPQLLRTFQNEFEAFEPSDYWKIVGAVVSECPKPALQHLLALLKLGNWDPVNFNTFFDVIRGQIPNISPIMQRQLGDAIEKVWNNFYPVSPKEGGFIMNLGVLYFEMKRYKDALTYFERAETLSGNSPALTQNIKICKHLIG